MKQATWARILPSNLFIVVALSGFSASAYGSVILSENFDELTPALGVTSAGAFSTINGTNVDIVGGSLFGSLCAPPESGHCVDMNGTSGNPQGQLQSNMQFSPGEYLLSFDLIGSARGITASVTAAFGNYNQMFTLASNDTISGIVANQPVVLTSPGYLLFASDITGDSGLLLDNVVVSTVPEPTSFVPLGSALLAGAIALARRESLNVSR
jgi:hypothetical protein